MTLADALTILRTLTGLPPYVVWIVGGSAEEREFLVAFAQRHPALGELIAAGRCLIWGHVDAEGMAEVYSRSTVTVVPSTFEQFGLVAAEAMACGSPVVASRTGGLTDIVAEGLTGELVPVDSGQALANALTGYLRNPQKARFQGTNAALWSEARFAASEVYEQVYRVVANGDAALAAATRPVEGVSHTTAVMLPPPSGIDQGSDERPTEGDDVDHRSRSTRSPTRKAWRQVAFRHAIPRVEELLGTAVAEWEDVSDQSQTGARVATAAGTFHVKVVHPRPHTLTTIFPMERRLRTPVRPAEILARYRLVDPSGLAPPLVATSDEHGLVVTRWCDPAGHARAADCERLMEGFAQLGRTLADPAAVEAFEHAVRDAEEGGEEAVARVDHAAARLNAVLTGGVHRFHRVHPQIELMRIALHAERPTWALPPEVAARLVSVSRTILAAHPIVAKRPELRHGSLKPVHVLSRDGALVTCDLDNMVFAVGQVDAIHWRYSDRSIYTRPLVDALSELRASFPTDEDFVLAACWLFVYVMHHVLDRTICGKPDGAREYASYLLGFPEASFRSGLIR